MFNESCCCFTGAITLCLTNPIWVTKTRLVLQYSSDPSQKLYRGMVDALVKIYRQEGVAGLYRVGRGVYRGGNFHRMSNTTCFQREPC